LGLLGSVRGGSAMSVPTANVERRDEWLAMGFPHIVSARRDLGGGVSLMLVC
jgi:hypothetical protein